MAFLEGGHQLVELKRLYASAAAGKTTTHEDFTVRPRGSVKEGVLVSVEPDAGLVPSRHDAKDWRHHVVVLLPAAEQWERVVERPWLTKTLPGALGHAWIAEKDGNAVVLEVQRTAARELRTAPPEVSDSVKRAVDALWGAAFRLAREKKWSLYAVDAKHVAALWALEKNPPSRQALETVYRTAMKRAAKAAGRTPSMILLSDAPLGEELKKKIKSAALVTLREKKGG